MGIQWYDMSSGGSALPNSTALVNGNHYYASQTVSGCESTSRLDVTVTINNAPTTTGVTICQGGSGGLTVTSTCDDINGTAGPSFAGSAATGGGTGSSWTNLSNISADDGNVVNTSVSNGTPGNSENLHITNFGFNIPSEATIIGITVAINRWGSSTTSGGIQDLVVGLVKNGTTPVGENKAIINTNWPNLASTVQTYGTSSDLWLTTWTPAEINASTFGLTLDVINANTSSSRTASVDFAQITVYYTIFGEIRWYTASTGGTFLGTGSP
ncbi:MAG: hypothetical protein IPN33_23960 [Saprospiraceae bacterium]|nr:hypothetical protein [Saprospiraceae bacterium]